MSELDPYVTYGGDPVKSLGAGRIGGRIVTFSGAKDPDRQKEFFDGSTDFWLNGTGERRPILYRHGLDPTLKRRRFGEIQITKAGDGLWASGYIAGKDDDSLKLMAMAERNELNWSSGSVGHLVAKSPAMGSMHIDEWPIAEVSLCLHDYVVEPRNIVSLKALCNDTPNFHDLIERSPFSQSAEHDAHQRDLERRAAEINEQTLKWQREHQEELEQRAAAIMQDYWNQRGEQEVKRFMQIAGLSEL